MAPDYRVIPTQNPIPTASNATLASIVKGVEQGANWGADLAAKIQDTRRENDPQTLAADQLKRDLINKQITEATRATSIENKLDEQFGSTERSAGISKSIEDIRAKRIENQLDSTYGASERQTKLNLEQAQIGSYSALAQERRNKANPAPRGPNPFPSKFDKSSFSEIPDPNTGGTAPTSANQIQLKSDFSSMSSAMEEGQNLEQRDAVTSTTIGQNLANQKLTGNIRRKEVSVDYYNTALAGITDAQAAEHDDIKNYDAVVGPLAGLGAAYREADDPKDQQLIAIKIGNIIRTAGPESIQGYLDNIEDPAKKSAATEVFSRAAALTGDPKLLTPDQKSIVQAGLTPDHAANPEKTYGQIDALIRGGSVGIDDPELKTAMRSSEYVIAANKASKGGTQGYTIAADRISSGNGTSPDLTDGSQQSQKVIMFTGADGTKFPAPVPSSPAEDAQLNLVEKVAAQQQSAISSKQKVQQDVGQIQKTQAQVAQESQVGAPNTSQQSTRNDPLLEINSNPVTDVNQLPKSYPDRLNERMHSIYEANANSAKPMTYKEIYKAAQDQEKEYRQDSKFIDKAVATNNEAIAKTEDQRLTLQTAHDLALATNNTDFVGPNGKLDRAMNNLESLVGLSDEDKNRVKDLFQIHNLKNVLSKISGNVVAFRTNFERQELQKGTAGINSEFATVENALLGLNADIEQKRQINGLKTSAKRAGASSEYSESLETDYLTTTIPGSDGTPIKISAPLVVNSRDKLGKPGQPDFVANPYFQTAEQFLGLEDLPPIYQKQNSNKNLPLTGKSNSVGPSSPTPSNPGTSGSGGAGGVPPDVVGSGGGTSSAEADVVGGGKPNNQVPFTSTNGVSSSSSSGGSSSGEGVSTSLQEGISPQAKQVAQAVENQPEPPKTKLQKILDDPEAKQQYDSLVQTYRNRTGTSLDAAINGIDYLADSIIFNKGQALGEGFDFVFRGMSKEDAQVFESARQKAREEFGKENKWTAGAMDAFATAVDFTIGGGVAKGIGAAINATEAAPAIAKAVTKAGDIFASSGGAQILKQSVVDGAILTLREKNPEPADFLINTLGSAFIQKALIPVMELAPSVKSKIKEYVSTGAKPALARLLSENGVTSKNLFGWLDKAKSLSIPDAEVSVLGTSDELAGAVKPIIGSPEAKQAVISTASERSAAAEKAGAANLSSAGMADVGSAEELQAQASTAVNKIVNDFTLSSKEQATSTANAATQQALSAANKQKETAIKNTIKNVISGVSNAQEASSELYSHLGIKPVNLEKQMAQSTGGESTPILESSINDYNTVIDSVGSMLRGDQGVFRMMEEQHQELDPGIIQSLQNALGKYGTTASNLIHYVGTKLQGKGAPPLEPGQIASDIQNNFKFLDELRQAAGEKIESIGSVPNAEIQNLVIKTGNAAFEELGYGKNYYSQFVDKWGNLAEVEKNLVTQQGVLKTIYNRTQATGNSSLHDAIFKTNTRETLDKALGVTNAKNLENQSRSFDSAVKSIAEISKNAGKVDVPELSNDLKEALKITGSGDFFAEKLIKDGSGAINRLKRTLGPEQQEVLQQGVLRALKTRLTNTKINVDAENFRPTDLFKLNEVGANSWKNVKDILSPEQSDLLSAFMDREVALRKADNLLTNSANIPKGKEQSSLLGRVGRAVAKHVTLPATAVYTGHPEVAAATMALDLVGSAGYNIASKVRQRNLINALLQPPKDVNALVSEVADMLATKENGAKFAFSAEAKDNIRNVLLSVWQGSKENKKANRALDSEAAVERSNAMEQVLADMGSKR